MLLGELRSWPEDYTGLSVREVLAPSRQNAHGAAITQQPLPPAPRPLLLPLLPPPPTPQQANLPVQDPAVRHSAGAGLLPGCTGSGLADTPGVVVSCSTWIGSIFWDLTVTAGEMDGFSTGFWADLAAGGTGGVPTTGGLLFGRGGTKTIGGLLGGAGIVLDTPPNEGFQPGGEPLGCLG